MKIWQLRSVMPDDFRHDNSPDDVLDPSDVAR